MSQINGISSNAPLYPQNYIKSAPLTNEDNYYISKFNEFHKQQFPSEKLHQRSERISSQYLEHLKSQAEFAQNFADHYPMDTSAQLKAEMANATYKAAQQNIIDQNYLDYLEYQVELADQFAQANPEDLAAQARTLMEIDRYRYEELTIAERRLNYLRGLAV